MSRKNNPQSAILKLLSKKRAISMDMLKEASGEALTDKYDGKTKPEYAITRSIKNMVDAGLAEVLPSEQSEYIRLTPLGKQKLYRDELSNTNSVINPTWDGKWRMIILDLPEERKNEREALRYLLKKAGFVCAKNSVWVSPFPFEHFFGNIKKDFGLTSEMLIVVTNQLDESTEKLFLENFKQ